MKQLAQQIKDSNGDYSNLEGSPLLSPKVLMGNCIDDLNNMAETQAEIKVINEFLRYFHQFISRISFRAFEEENILWKCHAMPF